MNDIRIENVRRAVLNRRVVKIFDAYRLRGDAYVFVGQFSAPARTANRNLGAFANA